MTIDPLVQEGLQFGLLGRQRRTAAEPLAGTAGLGGALPAALGQQRAGRLQHVVDLAVDQFVDDGLAEQFAAQRPVGLVHAAESSRAISGISASSSSVTSSSLTESSVSCEL